ncbi:MAG TPA: carbon storage regulator [Polyangiaceae bacterium]|jgi:carbon storage regulator
MLILTRRKGQRIVIGNDVEIVVTEVGRGAVKFGIVAPPSLTILRGEVKDAVEQANREAATSELADECLRAPSVRPTSTSGSDESARLVNQLAAAEAKP